MDKQTRTRAEIQAEIEKLEEMLKMPDWDAGEMALLPVVVKECSSPADAWVSCEAPNGDIYRFERGDLHPTADLIPRTERERLLAEAKKMYKLTARDAVAYLVKEYDLDTGHQDAADPRPYRHDYNGHAYRVTVEQVDNHSVEADKKGRDPAKMDAFVKVVKAILPSNICFDTPKDRRLRAALAAFEGIES